MRSIIGIILMAALLAIAGCDATGTAQGGGTGNTGRGQLKIGIPF